MLLFTILTEFIGTFIFLEVVLIAGQAIPIALALAGVLYFAGGAGHFNPAISMMMLAKGSISVTSFVACVTAQIVAGLMALLWHRYAILPANKKYD